VRAHVRAKRVPRVDANDAAQRAEPRDADGDVRELLVAYPRDHRRASVIPAALKLRREPRAGVEPARFLHARHHREPPRERSLRAFGEDASVGDTLERGRGSDRSRALKPSGAAG
jgi:hypothetical protein